MPLVSLRKALGVLGKSDKTLRRWVKEGAPHEKDVNGAYLVDPDELREWRRERDQEKREHRAAERARRAESSPTAALQEATNSHAAAAPAEPWESDPNDDGPAEALLALGDATHTLPRSSSSKARKRRKRHAPGSVRSDEKFAQYRAATESEPETPRGAEIRERAALNALLTEAVSATITRVPEKAADLLFFGRGVGQVRDTWGLSRRELAKLVASGGFPAYLDKNLGRGHFVVTWNGAGGQALHTQKFELPTYLEPKELDAPSAKTVSRRRRKRAENLARWVGVHLLAGLHEATNRSVEVDSPDLREILREVLEDCAPRLFPRPLYDLCVCAELEPFLPACPPSVVPWQEVLRPAPSPQERWLADWVAAFDSEVRRRTGRPAGQEFLDRHVAPRLRARASTLFPRAPGGPGSEDVWRTLSRFLPPRRRRA
jgi:hypothetical protein